MRNGLIRQVITPDTHIANIYIGLAVTASLEIAHGEGEVIDNIPPAGDIHFLVISAVCIGSYETFSVPDHAGNGNTTPGRIGNVSAANLTYFAVLALPVQHPATLRQETRPAGTPADPQVGEEGINMART